MICSVILYVVTELIIRLTFFLKKNTPGDSAVHSILQAQMTVAQLSGAEAQPLLFNENPQVQLPPPLW